MPNRNQRSGWTAESRCRQALVKDGYLVWKSGGSLTVADLIAAKPGEWLLVQVKAGGRLEHGWFNELAAIAWTLSSGGHAGAYGLVHGIVADWPEKTGSRWGPMRLRRITGRHREHAQSWPLEPFSTDIGGE